MDEGIEGSVLAPTMLQVDAAEGEIVGWSARTEPARRPRSECSRPCSSRLVVIITWDEGSRTDNHIPTLVISPTTTQLAPGNAFTHCSTLRTVEEILRLSLLGCARNARRWRPGSP